MNTYYTNDIYVDDTKAGRDSIYSGDNKLIIPRLIVDGKDAIHKINEYSYSFNSTAYIDCTTSGVSKNSNCGQDFLRFSWQINMRVPTFTGRNGDYNITMVTTKLYTDQKISLVVKYGPSRNPTKYSETVAEFSSGYKNNNVSWSGTFVTEEISDCIDNASIWVESYSDDSPMRIGFSYSNVYTGITGSTNTGWYNWNNLHSGYKLSDFYKVGSTYGTTVYCNSKTLTTIGSDTQREY